MLMASLTEARPPSPPPVIHDSDFRPVTLPLLLEGRTRAPLPRELPDASTPEQPSPSPTPREQPQPSPRSEPISTPRPTSAISGAINGTATWYCLTGVSRCPTTAKNGLYAAISPDLAFLRGQDISVCYRSSCVVVKVIDCNCQAERSVDLFADAFRLLAPLDRGRIRVTISW